MTRVLFLSAVCLPPVTAISYAQHGTVLFQPLFFSGFFCGGRAKGSTLLMQYV